MEKVLIIGGAGYIGSMLVHHLLKRKYRVTVLDNLLYGQRTLFQYVSNPDFNFVFGDARDESIVKELIKNHDAIIPLAALVGARVCDLDPIMATTLNLDSILLLNKLRSAQQKVIWPCTNSGYGTKSGEMFCTEETAMEPITLYGETKVKAENALLEQGNAISLRLATVFGPSPRMRIDLLVNDFVYRAFTDRFLVIFEKDFKRNYIHVDDVCEAFCFCLEHFDEMKGEPYNVGLNEANLSKAELADKIKEYIPQFYIHYAEVGSDPDKRNYIVSNEKIKKKGFEATHSLDEGIKQLITTYQMFPRGRYANV